MIDNSIQVQIPEERSSHSFIFKMKCEATSNTIHDVLLSKEIPYKSFKEICSGEPMRVNLGHWGNWKGFIVENNSLVPTDKSHPEYYIHGLYSLMALDHEVLFKFFSNHNIEPNWLHCNYTYGHYDEELGGWTGCVGKV